MKSIQYLKNIIYPVLIANLLLFIGCSRTTASPVSKTSIEEKFLTSFNKTTSLGYPIYTNTKIAGKTFWIYIATRKELLTINTKSAVGGVVSEKIIKFMDIKCRYENSSFNLDYIFLKYTPEELTEEMKSFKKSIGGRSEALYQDFTDTTIEILQKAYFAIGDIISETEHMNFFAICLADIKKGIKITFVIHRLDMEQFLLNMLPSDEFYNRMILKTGGSKDIINDKYGLSVEYHDISLIDFLREQIINNAVSVINEMEKYESEKLKAINALDDIIANSLYEVTTKYEFDDYIMVEIQNIINKETTMFTKSKLVNKFSKPAIPSSLEESSL